MTHTTKLSDGTTAHVNVTGKPKGSRKVQLPNGMYYIAHGGHWYVYESNGEFVTALGSQDQARKFAERRGSSVGSKKAERFVVLNGDGIEVGQYTNLAHANEAARDMARAARQGGDTSNFYSVASPDGSEVAGGKTYYAKKGK